MAKNATDGKIDELVAQLAELASERGAHIAVAESLTGGQLSTALAAGPHSGDWYRGAVVCYHADVKFEVLGVPRGPVINARTARAMAAGVKNLLRADVAVGITGVGGPGPEEGRPAGTVYLSVICGNAAPRTTELACAGDPVAVLTAAIDAALRAVIAALALDHDSE
ncbi:C-terminal domain of CinA type S [Leucobacter sp. 7(1)]|uniref:CinA family protein n=1 Tax=Leucobacter sp. 7(1) TaxID=1255613 RepID=UPI00097EF78C|nr:CinA family protein [Leucobacter sp. 7(1)]SJN10837.1 C-terminal domain of CinA type S [Leucobacter sp. 7(1)]